jgi:MFS-type transporter involved in bile tolerance (Atg22 family)
MGMFTPLANVSLDTYIARVVPPGRLARVYALQRITVVGAGAVGVFAVAIAIDATSGADVIAMADGWMLLVGLFALARVWFGR